MAIVSKPALKPGGPHRKILYWAAVGLVWLVMLGALFGAWITHDLPDVSDLPPPGSQSTMVIKAANGKTVANYGPVYGDWLDYRDVPEVMVLALLAVEDRRFFAHSGVDIRGIARAAWANVQAGGITQGGSTLTQQLAKNLFLSPRRTMTRKAQELLLAWWLEREFTKEQILSLYLNRVYFGAGTYGIDAAARTYFGHSARRLTLSEAAMLAGLVKAPSRLAPTRNYKGAVARANEVLGAMVAGEFLTEQAAARARTRPAELAEDAAGADVRYFADWVAAQATALVGKQDGPVAVLTTLDPTAQHAAERSLRERLEAQGQARNASQGALVSLAPDGAVLAMMGGRSYGQSQFNRAVQARRQPGSAFKPVVYLAGLETGLTPQSVMEDAPIALGDWTPQNFSGGHVGPMTLRDAFSGSVNTVAVRVLQHAGAEKVVDVAHRLGITADIAPVPSIALGAAAMPLIELTAAYAAIANGGYAVEPYAIVEIQAADGEILHRHSPGRSEPVIAAGHVTQLTQMMRQTILKGTGRYAAIDRPAAGKTGTSQDFRDALFVGFTSDLVTGVWVGNDDDTPMNGVTGGSLPTRIWADFMLDAHVGRPVRPLMAEMGY